MFSALLNCLCRGHYLANNISQLKKKTSYPTISFAKILSDFYKSGSGSKLLKAEFEIKYDLTVCDDTLLEFHYIFLPFLIKKTRLI